MTVFMGPRLAQGMLGAVEATVNANGAAVLEIRTAAPTNVIDQGGTVLASIALPTDWLNAAVFNNVSLVAMLSDASINASGTAGQWIIKDGAGFVMLKGGCSGPGGGAEMIITNPILTAGEQLNLTSFNLSFANELI